jgi:hypothetical protein
MGQQVIIEPVVIEYLADLINVLYKEEYFGFFESSVEYADKITNFMLDIPNQKSKLTQNKRYGKYYCKYKHNSKTSWYIVFDIENDVYLISFITNNHSHNYPTYIRGQ